MFEADDNAILDCSLTCFDGSEDLHNQDGKLVIKMLVDGAISHPFLDSEQSLLQGFEILQMAGFTGKD